MGINQGNLNEVVRLEEEIKKIQEPDQKKVQELGVDGRKCDLDKLAKEAEKAILDKLKLPPIRIERYSERSRVNKVD